LYRLSLEPGKLLQEGYAQNYGVQGPSGVATPNLEEEPENGTTLDRIMMQVARNSSLSRKLYWKLVKRELKQVHIRTRNDIMHPPINAVFANNTEARKEWLQEYFVPGEKLEEFIGFLGSVLDENKVALMNASVRYVSKDERAKMGYATEGDRFALVLFFSQSLNPEEVKKTEKWVQHVVEWLGDNEGTFYLPYMHFATTKQFRKCYPQWQEVLEKKNEYDPKCVFHNGLCEDYFVKSMKDVCA